MSTIILTGAICPSWPVMRNDPIVRLTDYLCAVRRWLDVPTLKQVIYCDASGCRIPKEVFSSEKFESLNFDASDHARQYEAGRAEMETLAFILNHSRFSFDSFFKCTGRLFVNNFESIRGEIGENRETGFALRPWYRPDWADTRLFWMTVEKFRTLIELRIEELTGQINNGHVVESLFFEYMGQASQFSEPRLIGHHGHGNHLYDKDYSHGELHFANQIIRKFGHDYFLLD